MTGRQRPRGAAPQASVGESPPWLVGQQWTQLRFRQPGWMILPLRAFLAVTFMYAGLQKLANPTYLNPANAGSVVGQMRLLRHVSPIGPLLGLSLHAPTAVGFLIAFGELAVGVGVAIGLWTRLAALGGMALSLTFLLTVSWRTTPYYYGSDIVFLFAWSVLAGMGAGNVLSIDGWLLHRARVASGVRALPAVVAVEVPRLRQICARHDACGMTPSGACGREHCGIYPVAQRLRPAAAADLNRRRFLLGGRAVLLTGAVAVTTGGLAAWIGRLVGGTDAARQAALGHSVTLTPSASPSATPTTSATPSPTAAHSRRPPAAQHPTSQPSRSRPLPGTPVGQASQVPVGQAGSFTDPASGNPAYVVHTNRDNFVAFSAVCTHAGCTVQFDSRSMEFICPCHGGAYDARTGRVVAGPPPSPLPAIPVHVINGVIRVD